MAYFATNVFPTDGVKTYWDFSFAGVNPDSGSGSLPYIAAADVKALELYFDEGGIAHADVRTVTIDPGLPNRANIDGIPIIAGRQIRIFRQTEVRFPLVDYRDRQSVSELDLDMANRQNIFIAQETLDAAKNNLLQDAHGNYDANGARIVNLAPGINGLDAVNLNQLNHSLRIPAGEAPTVAFPSAAERANKFVTFDAAGNPIALLPSPTSAEGLALLLSTAAGADQVGTDGPEGTVQDALNSRVVGNIDQRYAVIAGAFRKNLADGPIWAGIFDETHQPSYMIEPVEAATELQLRYPGNSNIGSMAVVPDERFAAYGVTVGASVGKDECFVRMGAPCEYTVNFTAPDSPTTPGITIDTKLFGAQRFTAAVAESGLITLGHPQLQGKVSPSIQFRAPSSTAAIAHPHVITTSSPGQTTLFLLARMAGRMRFDGANWLTSFSPYNSLITASYNGANGELTVTHPGLTANNAPQATVSTGTLVSEGYTISEVGTSDTTFIVRFRKTLDDSIPAVLPAGVGITFDRGMTAILPKSVITGSITVFLDVVQLDIRDVNFPLANLWALGVMGRDNL